LVVLERHNGHCRYFQIAGITVRIESDLNFAEVAFTPELSVFAVAGPGEDNVTLRHHFEFPRVPAEEWGQELRLIPPWAISRLKSGDWIYRNFAPDGNVAYPRRIAVFSTDHRQGDIYGSPRDLERIRETGWHTLSLFPTDQIWLTPLLADRQAVWIHSGAAIVNGKGLVFIGRSTSGKSSTMDLLKAARGRTPGNAPLRAEVLCDDGNVLRKWPASANPGGWRVYGTWSHSSTADVSGASAPLRAILFLERSAQNDIIPLDDRKAIWPRLLGTVSLRLTTAASWHKQVDVLQQVVADIPCFLMRFDKSAAILEKLAELAGPTQ
jgi:hypothetical protein